MAWSAAAVGGCPGLYPPTASTSDEDAAATPNSSPRAPAGALLVVPHATGCDAATAQVLPSPAPHTAASTAATRPACFAFMPSPLRRQVPWMPPVAGWAANQAAGRGVLRAGFARTPFIRRGQGAVLPPAAVGLGPGMNPPGGAGLLRLPPGGSMQLWYRYPVIRCRPSRRS